MKLRLILILACAALVASSCAKKEGEGANAAMGAGAAGNAAGNGKADSMKAAYKAVSEAWDAGNVDVFDKYIAVNSVDHNPMPGMPQGLAGMKEMAKVLKTAYPDMKSVNQDFRVDGDILTVRWSMSGTNSGPFMGMPPTNKKISDIGGIDQVRWENGKFVEHWGYMDEHKMMQQLGLAPADGGDPHMAATPANKDMKMGGDMKKK